MLVSCKSYKIKNVYFKSETKTVNAKVIRIDSTENDYVYFLKNDTMNAFFTKSILCKQIFKSIIDTTKNYQLNIKIDANYNYLSKTYSEIYYHEGTDTTFNYKDYRLIILDSPDICGKNVNCKENLKFKEKFFSNIKIVDSLHFRNQNKQFSKSLSFISKYSHVTFESKTNYTGLYPEFQYKHDRKIWIDWYEKNKCTNIQLKE